MYPIRHGAGLQSALPPLPLRSCTSTILALTVVVWTHLHAGSYTMGKLCKLRRLGRNIVHEVYYDVDFNVMVR